MSSTTKFVTQTSREFWFKTFLIQESLPDRNLLQEHHSIDSDELFSESKLQSLNTLGFKACKKFFQKKHLTLFIRKFFYEITIFVGPITGLQFQQF